jgi:ABC-2 type transport system ATP-binding protein
MTALPAESPAPVPARTGSSERESAQATAGADVAVSLGNASRWYGNVVAVNDVSFNLSAGITGLLGPNGAGKSTVLHMIAGLLRPSAGTVQVGGEGTWQNPGIYRKVGLVPERETVHGFLTAHEFVLLNARLQGLDDPAAATARAIDTVQLAEAQHRRLDTYSKGMRQRAKVAAALVHDPLVLLLDEPFNGMDPRQRLQTMNMLHSLAENGRTIVVSSHILEEVDRLAGTVLVMIAGRLAASGPSRAIRKLMTDRPHTFSLRSSDDRTLASALMAAPIVKSVELGERGITIRVSDYGALARLLPGVAVSCNVTIYELLPADESLESVFSYLVQR